MKVIDVKGFERTIGNLNLDDKLVVTSQDGTMKKVYFLTLKNTPADVLAYVMSADASTMVNQEMNVIEINGHKIEQINKKVGDVEFNLDACNKSIGSLVIA